jgi:2',3'-cyclic-nucleotide 2'-phosphodiesterase (5'-nucleotidase family)
MMNLNNPVWSDVYTCTEWAWFNGLLEGMAVGNHEFDYGPEVYQDCANRVTYPIISSGLVYSDTLESYLPEYQVYEVDGIKVGVFAVVGDDYPRIVRPEMIPPGTRWLTGEEKLERAAEIVDILRNEEQVDYIDYVSHVTLSVQDGQVVDVQGELIPIDSNTPQDEVVADKVDTMQAALEVRHPERDVLVV